MGLVLAETPVPGEFSEGIFVTLVVLSQIGLFVCSSIAAKKAGFWYEDQAGLWRSGTDKFPKTFWLGKICLLAKRLVLFFIVELWGCRYEDPG